MRQEHARARRASGSTEFRKPRMSSTIGSVSPATSSAKVWPAPSVTSCSSARSSRPPLASMVKVRDGFGLGRQVLDRQDVEVERWRPVDRPRPSVGSRVCQYQPESGREKLPPLSPSTAALVHLAVVVGGGDQRQQQRLEPRVEIALDRARELAR